MQKGKLPDHSPVAMHVLCESPTSLKPLLQLYVTTDPSVVPNTRLLPKKGVPGSSHSAVAACVGDEELQHVNICERKSMSYPIMLQGHIENINPLT